MSFGFFTTCAFLLGHFHVTFQLIALVLRIISERSEHVLKILSIFELHVPQFLENFILFLRRLYLVLSLNSFLKTWILCIRFQNQCLLYGFVVISERHFHNIRFVVFLFITEFKLWLFSVLISYINLVFKLIFLLLKNLFLKPLRQLHDILHFGVPVIHQSASLMWSISWLLFIEMILVLTLVLLTL